MKCLWLGTVLSSSLLFATSLPVGDKLTINFAVEEGENNHEVICTRFDSAQRLMVCLGQKYQGILFNKDDSQNLKLFLIHNNSKTLVSTVTIEFQEDRYLFTWSDIGSLSVDIFDVYMHSYRISKNFNVDKRKLDDLFNAIKDVDCSFQQFIDDNKYKSVTQKIKSYNNRNYSYLKIKNSDKNSVNKNIFLDNSQDNEEIIIDYNKARLIIDEVIKKSEISFDYIDDGCYARAHVISYMLHQQKIKTGKIWLKGPITNQYLKEKNLRWAYHVAALIYVNDNGTIKPFVIDLNQLFSIDHWLEFYIDKKKYPPCKLEYPLPERIHPFYDYVFCFSSHEPLWPSSCPLIFDDEVRKKFLNYAFEVNKVNCSKKNK